VSRDPFLSARQVAEELGVSRATAYRLMHDMVHFKRGKLLRVSRESFNRYIRRLEVDPWHQGSTSGVRSGGRGTTSRVGAASASPPSAPTGGRPSLRCVSGSAVPPIQPTRPRTKPRLPQPSSD
jgi:excisionase family DNA binding protein